MLQYLNAWCINNILSTTFSVACLRSRLRIDILKWIIIKGYFAGTARASCDYLLFIRTQYHVDDSDRLR